MFGILNPILEVVLSVVAAEDHSEAKLDYESGMKYKDIADKYSVSINTVKSWQKRFGWTRGKGAPETEKG